MAEEEEFDCEEFLMTPPGAGLNGIIEGFTAGLDAMIEPFELALSVAIGLGDLPPWLVVNAGVAVPGMVKVAAMPAILSVDLMMKLNSPDANLPAMPVPGIGDFGALSIPDPTHALSLGLSLGDMMIGLIMIPLDMLIAVVGNLDPSLFSVDGVAVAIEGLGLPDRQAALNLTKCIEAIIESKVPFKAYEPSGAEKAAAKEKNQDEFNMGYEDGKADKTPALPRPDMVPEQLDSETNEPIPDPPNYYKDGYYHGWAEVNKVKVIPPPPNPKELAKGIKKLWDQTFPDRVAQGDTVPHWDMDVDMSYKPKEEVPEEEA
jgi:hypothetical protein